MVRDVTEATQEQSGSATRRWLATTFGSLFAPFTVFVWAALIVFAVVAGPFGTFDAMSMSVRLVFWVIVVSVSVVLGYAVRGVTAEIVAPEDTPKFDILATLLMTLVFTPVLLAVSHIIMHLTGVAVPDWKLLLLYVFVTSGFVFGVRRLAPGFEPSPFAGEVARPVAIPEPETPRLMRRLPKSVRAPILRISAQGHHVEIVTEVGRHTLRMRISDAIDEMDPVEGYCVHRSHWVTRAAVLEVVRESAHKSHAVLTNGETIPVSRKYRPALVEAGVIPS